MDIKDLKNKVGLNEESIHLFDWPKSEKKKIDKKLEANFEILKRVIEFGLSERDKAKIGLKWPLAKAIVSVPDKTNEKLKEIIARQLNVKEIKIKKDKEIKVELDTTMTPELEAEGFSRELARKVQAERKKAGLKKEDIIDLKVYVEKHIKKMLDKHLNFIKERTNSKKVYFVDGELGKKAISFKIKDKKLSIELR